MENKTKVYIGLDLGIASVGWSLVDENQNVIAAGSHLFKQLSVSDRDDEYGEKIRGEKRRTRRMLRRKKQRKIDFLNMIDINCFTHQQKLKKTNKPSIFYKEKYQKMFGFNENESASDFLFSINRKEQNKYDIWKIYKEGFERELQPKELFLFLYFKLAFRGVFFKKYKWEKDIKSYTYNDSLLKNVFVDGYFKTRGKYRDKANADENFSIYWNWCDIECILRKCDYISEEFIEDYKSIFLRQRDFSKGPGSPKSYTPWGVYDENGKLQYNNLWEKRIGKCDISEARKYQGKQEYSENRANKIFALPEISNLISQLINVKVESITNKKLAYEQICELINFCLTKRLTIKRLRSYLKISDNDSVSGYPQNKQKTDSNFEELKKIRNTYFDKEKGALIINDEDIDIVYLYDFIKQLDEVRRMLLIGFNPQTDKSFIPWNSEIKSFYENQKSKDKIDKDKNKTVKNNKDFERCKKLAKEIIDSLKWDNIKFKINFDNFCNFNEITEDDLSGSYQYGISAFQEYIENFLNLNELKNFNVFFKEEIYLGKLLKLNINNESLFLNVDMFAQQDFISSNAMNTIRESIKVLNKIFKEYIFKTNIYKLDAICIETTWNSRESVLSKNQKQAIADYQSYQDKLRKDAKDCLIEQGINPSKENIKKYILAKQQDFLDIYDKDKSLRIVDIEKWQIDHIIPYSISFNNNFDNLVVTLRNSEKGQRTPVQFLKSNEFNELKQWWNVLLGIKEESDNNKKNGAEKGKKSKPSINEEIKIKRYKWLTLPSGDEFKQGFINSNLCETTYAISKFKEGLEFFFENLQEKYINKNDTNFVQIKNCKIRSISGKWSQELREYFQLDDKNREINKSHHSVDASICAIYFSIPKICQLYNELDETKWWYKGEHETQKYFNKHVFIYDDQTKRKKIAIVNEDKKNEIKTNISNIKCLYSFKPVSIFPSYFPKLKIEHQLNMLRKIKPKEIFDSQNYGGFIKSEDIYHEKIVAKIQGNDTEKNNIYLMFNAVNKWYLYECSKQKEPLNEKSFLKNIQIFLKEPIEISKGKRIKILTNAYEIWNLYKCLINYDNNDGLTTYDFEKYEKTKSIFDNYLDFLYSTDKKVVLLKMINNNENLLKSLIATGIPYISNNKLYVVKKISYIDYSEYNPAFIFNNDKSNKIKNKWILNNDNSFVLSNNKSLYGNATKCIVIIEHFKKQKDKIKRCVDFYKINQLNKTVNQPTDSKILEIIDYDKWFKIDGEIFSFCNFEIKTKRISFQCISTPFLKEEYEFTNDNINRKVEPKIYKCPFSTFCEKANPNSAKYNPNSIECKIFNHFNWQRHINKNN